MRRSLVFFGGVVLLVGAAAKAEPPHASYIFPAGGQRGTTVSVRIGGHFLHERAPFEILGEGIKFPSEIHRAPTTWFEGPLIRQPASQRAEDYPQDYAGLIQIAVDAAPGKRWWRCWNAQGITQALPFVVGELPEIVEQEIDGEPLPVPVSLPVTINGRIFPREDIDSWQFDAQAGQSVTCAVVAHEIGSPLVAKLSIHDNSGNLLNESTGAGSSEAKLRFVAPQAGKYQVRITDVAADGLQHFVYRLTVTSGPWIDHIYPLGGRRGSQVKLEMAGQGLPTGKLDFQVPDAAPGIVAKSITIGGQTTNAIKLDLSDLVESLEAEPNEDAARAAKLEFPSVLNGRIQSPGDLDVWSLALVKGQPVLLESRGARLGSPLAMVLTIRDETGKQLAQADGSTVASGDPLLAFNPPADGTYLVEVSERFVRRGGPAFAYRVQLTESQPDFSIFAPDGVSVDMGGEKKVEVAIERRGDWQKVPLTLHVAGLPAGVVCDDVTLPANAAKGSLTFKCAADVPVSTSLVTITGRAEWNGQIQERSAQALGTKEGFARGESISTRLVTTLPTPFKFTAQFSTIYAPRGGLLKKTYQIDRAGFEGPLEARLADRQGRHLQGVTGPVVVVPPGVAEFEYPLTLPSWMELGRTSRSNLMLTGEVADAAGKLHKVCFTTKEQNEQLIAIVSPGPLRLGLAKAAFACIPGEELSIPVSFKRDGTFPSALKLELVVPSHMRDLAAEPVFAPAGSTEGTLILRVGAAPGPLNMPLVIRATGQREGEPIVAEANLELVPPK